MSDRPIQDQINASISNLLRIRSVQHGNLSLIFTALGLDYEKHTTKDALTVISFLRKRDENLQHLEEDKKRKTKAYT